MSRTEMHPLIKACLFYYEFVFIHPFDERNEEFGLRWFLVILKEWHSFLTQLPVDTLIYERREEYYLALRRSKNGDSAVFVAFLLRILYDALKEMEAKLQLNNDEMNNVGVKTSKYVGTKNEIHVNRNEEKVLMLLEQDPKMTAKGLAVKVGLTDRQIERILARLKKEGRIERIGASKNGYWKVM